tara:strand:+ start:4018 stop:4752 length:735 start_codon:yes stop_codon:yes gene_type:complete
MNLTIQWHERLGSTNQHLKNELLSGHIIPSGTLIAAYDQTAGTGRFNRPWIAPPHTNLCCSLYLATQAPLTAIPSLTMATALAVHDLLRTHRISAQPKWPNDLLVNGKKICGILSEQIEDPATQQRGIITGIGLNLNLTPAQAAAIDQPATSMLIETGKPHSLEETLQDLLPHLTYWIKQWQTDHFNAIRPTWEAATGPLNRPLTIRDGDHLQHGTLAGYGEHGQLLLQTPNGIQTIWSGEIPL